MTTSTKTKEKRGEQRGFTLLIAALVASIVLALGTAIFSIAQKELTLSSAGRNSQFAFYAADTGAECALYHDVRFAYFATSTPQNDQTPKCDGQTLTGVGGSLDSQRPLGANPYPYTMTFQYTITTTDLSNAQHFYCAQVAVTKNSIGNSITTIVHSDGFSAACANIQTDPQALQRSVELTY